MKLSIEFTGFGKPKMPKMPKIKKPSTDKSRLAIIKMLQSAEKALQPGEKT